MKRLSQLFFVISLLSQFPYRAISQGLDTATEKKIDNLFK